MSLNWTKDLNIESLPEFAAEYAGFTYNKALATVISEGAAMRLAVNTLCRLFLLRARFYAEEQEYTPKEAILKVMSPLIPLNRRKRFTNPLLTLDTPPADAICAEVAKKVCRRIETISPRYAPSFSALKTAALLCVVTAVITGTILFIWSDPFEWISRAESEEQAAVLSSTVIYPPQSNALVDISLRELSVPRGSVPVEIRFSGPDADRVKEIVYSSDKKGSLGKVYNCTNGYGVFIADESDTYTVTLRGENGLEINRAIKAENVASSAPAFTVTDLAISADLDTLSFTLSSSVGVQSVTATEGVSVAQKEDGSYIASALSLAGSKITAEDESGNASSIYVNDNANVLYSPRIEVKSFAVPHDKTTETDLAALLPKDHEYTFEIESRPTAIKAVIENGILALTPQSGFVGVDSITLSVTDEHSLTASFVFPVVVTNSAPRIEQSNLFFAAKHTPTHEGYVFSRLSGVDDDGDKVTYLLESAENCSVMISKDGGFLLFVDNDYAGGMVSFTFTMTDGILVSEPYKYTVTLINNLISEREFSQDMICYSGEDGYYMLNLPKTDIDGDPLTWRVKTELADGKTAKGHTVLVEDDGAAVKVILNPSVNENDTQTLILSCSDGWVESDNIIFTCNIAKNMPPEAGESNSAVLSAEQVRAVLDVDVENDCAFDKIVISEIISSEGCTVEDETGFENLKFTVNMNDGAEQAVVVLRVSDTLTGDSVVVTYTISRKLNDAAQEATTATPAE
ncbi:MAG: hypothetical protein LBL82_07125 [Oscillospiraceae bacterium]|jgi:hypothetical protein|nr:hypothetical protein [Oscillospiraceae bacterium]